jgi:hypothetical protein
LQVPSPGPVKLQHEIRIPRSRSTGEAQMRHPDFVRFNTVPGTTLA